MRDVPGLWWCFYNKEPYVSKKGKMLWFGSRSWCSYLAENQQEDTKLGPIELGVWNG